MQVLDIHAYSPEFLDDLRLVCVHLLINHANPLSSRDFLTTILYDNQPLAGQQLYAHVSV
jgi:hypothetical protein